MSNGLSMRKWLKGAPVSGVWDGQPYVGGMGLKRVEMGENVLGLV